MNEQTHQLDTSECEAFARLWFAATGTRHITLTAIPAAGGSTTTMTFAVGAMDALRRWVERQQGRMCNVYFQPNETHPDCRKKPSKNEMIAVLCRHADVDPMDDLYLYAEERERLHQVAEFLHKDEAAPPTFLLDSGNGIYPLRVVSRQLLTPEVLSAVEAENQEVEAAVGAAGTLNIDRLLRLPGTLNFPNAKKQKLGRGVTRARVLHHSDKTYTVEQASGLGAHLQKLLPATGLVRFPAEPERYRRTRKKETKDEKRSH